MFDPSRIPRRRRGTRIYIPCIRAWSNWCSHCIPLFPYSSSFMFLLTGHWQMSGVFIITVDTGEHMLHLGSSQVPNFQLNADLQDTPFPRLAGCQVLPFCDFLDLEIVTCLQMTNSRLYLVCHSKVINIHNSMVRKFQEYADLLESRGDNDTDHALGDITESDDLISIEDLHRGLNTGISGKCTLSVLSNRDDLTSEIYSRYVCRLCLNSEYYLDVILIYYEMYNIQLHHGHFALVNI